MSHYPRSMIRPRAIPSLPEDTTPSVLPTRLRASRRRPSATSAPLRFDSYSPTSVLDNGIEARRYLG